MAAAVAAGWRVAGFVTPVPSRSEEVSRAARASATKGSPERFCESTTTMPSQPAASARTAARGAYATWAMPVVHISTATRPPVLVPGERYGV